MDGRLEELILSMPLIGLLNSCQVLDLSWTLSKLSLALILEAILAWNLVLVDWCRDWSELLEIGVLESLERV